MSSNSAIRKCSVSVWILLVLIFNGNADFIPSVQPGGNNDTMLTTSGNGRQASPSSSVIQAVPMHQQSQSHATEDQIYARNKGNYKSHRGNKAKSSSSSYTQAGNSPSPAESYYSQLYYGRPGRAINSKAVSSNYPMMSAAASSQVGFNNGDRFNNDPGFNNNGAVFNNGPGFNGGTGFNNGPGFNDIQSIRNLQNDVDPAEDHSGPSGGGGLRVGGGQRGHGKGHGWGGGWGWEHHMYQDNTLKLDNTAVSLFGVMGLLSFLSNVLTLLVASAAAAATATTTAATTTTAAPGGRRRREIKTLTPRHPLFAPQVEKTCLKLLPSLNVVGNAQHKRLPVNCTHQEICTMNHILVKDFGQGGHAAGSLLSLAILKMLQEVDKSPNMEKYFLQASLDGRNGENCARTHPTCKTLEMRKRESFPQLISPQHVSAFVYGRRTPPPPPHLVFAYS